MPLRYNLTFLCLLFLVLSSPVQAQDGVVECGRASGKAELNIGDIRATIYNQGNLFYGPNVGFEVPKGSGNHSHFADTFILGGFVDGELRVSGSTYGNYEMWPGPLDDQGMPVGNCDTFDRLWEGRADEDLDPGQLTSRVLEWPADLGAPYTDVDGQPGYHPDNGDRPLFRGEQSFWSVMNDASGDHYWTDSKPLRVEVTSESWAFNEGLLKHVTFHRYVVTNKNPLPIRDMYVGRFVDVDLGDPWDDMVGSDTTLSMLYFYTRHESDGVYGSPAPALGLIGIEARHSSDPLPSNIGDDPGSFISTVITPNKGGGPHAGPDNAEEYYRYLRGIWRNGDPLVAGGFGWPGSWDGRGIDIHVPYIYPGDPATGEFWSQMNLDGGGIMAAESDKRGIVGFGPFDLEPGQWAACTYAYVWAQGNSFLDSVSKMKEHARVVHQYKDNFLAYSKPEEPEFIDGNPPEEAQHPFWVDEPYPNPASDQLILRYSLSLDGPVTIRIVDALGRVRLRHQATASTGQDDVSLDISSLPSGPYSVSIQSWSHRASHSFMVLR